MSSTSAGVQVATGSPGDEALGASGIFCAELGGGGGRAELGRLLGGAFSMSDGGGEGLAAAGGGTATLDFAAAVDRVADETAAAAALLLLLTGVGDGCGGARTGLRSCCCCRASSMAPGLSGTAGYAMSSALGLGVVALGIVCDPVVGATGAATTSWTISAGLCSSSSTCTSGCSSNSSGSGPAFFAFVFLFVVLARFVFVVFALAPAPAPFLFPFAVAVDAVDMVDMTDTALVSIDSSRSGMSRMLGSAAAADSIVVLSPTDCVDRRAVDALEVRDALDERAPPFFARGRFDGAVVPAKWKKGQLGERR